MALVVFWLGLAALVRVWASVNYGVGVRLRLLLFRVK